MKKLKLKHLDLDMVEMLTKEQLKDVLGGDDDGGSGEESLKPCSSSSCTLSVQQSDGSWKDYNGMCSVKISSSPKHFFYTCYCKTDMGYQNVTSNGGVSRCT
ncbi:hypothetical protein [Elizabethkingia anophelis]|uniref:hypothetical protein n=1 Tax=Elizabethkingia anophelis TaxID=1117645 RepID=UPI003891858F